MEEKDNLKDREGTFHANSKGFGFVNYDENLPSAYISQENTKGALNGDTVAVDLTSSNHKKSDHDRGPTGKVTKVLNRKTKQLVGEFMKTDADKGYIGQIALTNKKFANFKCYVIDDGLKPTPGEVVVVEITEYPTAEHPNRIVGIAKQVIGSVDDPGVDILQVVHANEVPSKFPQDVLDEADNIPDHVLPEELKEKGREDLTDQKLVTIDSESSKDLDDAVTAWKLPNGNFHLGVHIADVSHYVKEGSPLDKEAYKRGTSVYLTDRVIPMLPRRLSNGICSLNEGETRLAMSCEMEITPQGKVVKERIHPSIIKTTARMTYTNVNKILENHDKKVSDEYKDLVPMFETMQELHHILYNKRHNRGAIDFEDNEAEIIVDKQGHPIDIKLRKRGTSERIIESFMLAANETVAEHYKKLKLPFVYRIHEKPDPTRLKEFFDTLGAFGINIKADLKDIKPKNLQDVLSKIKGKPEEAMVSVMMLRSLQQAKYSDKGLGHFGLAAPYYTHFTSPIRRYPDLMVHRLIDYYRENGINEKSKNNYKDKVGEIGEHTSTTERRGVDTEREVDSMKKSEYMSDKVGQEFDGIVTSVMNFGLFVQLPNTVEGLVHITRLKDDYYKFNEKNMTLVGERTKNTYKVGQPVRVRVAMVDVDQRKVDFEIIPNKNKDKKIGDDSNDQHPVENDSNSSPKVTK